MSTKNYILRFPTKIGEGYIKMVDLETGLKLVTQRHKLKEDLVFKRNAYTLKNDVVTITFNTFDRPVVFIQDTVNNKGINLSSISLLSD